MPDAVLPILSGAHRHDTVDAKVEKVYLYPKPVDFRKSIDGLAVLTAFHDRMGVLIRHYRDARPACLAEAVRKRDYL